MGTQSTLESDTPHSLLQSKMTLFSGTSPRIADVFLEILAGAKIPQKPPPARGALETFEPLLTKNSLEHIKKKFANRRVNIFHDGGGVGGSHCNACILQARDFQIAAPLDLGCRTLPMTFQSQLETS
eukprot:TRINITY_DN4370_c1_g1_i1.p1 TRINITY_DN4370_c1_g1~~TRINITY_DN4370_c1_g1_i1.p1  ORF type:complete len:127 (-),score=3.97 TRINITY_DN4370_c1_g1_i1:326-706(-)